MLIARRRILKTCDVEGSGVGEAISGEYEFGHLCPDARPELEAMPAESKGMKQSIMTGTRPDDR